METPPKKRRGRPPNPEKKAKVATKKKRKKAVIAVKPERKRRVKPLKIAESKCTAVSKPDTKERIYCKLVLDLSWLGNHSTDKQINSFARRCSYQRTYQGGYDKETYVQLQYLLDKYFKDTSISVSVKPLTISIGGHTVRELYGREDFFHAEVSFEKGLIKVPQGGTALQKDTVLFNELNSFVPKDIKRATGFISL